MAETVSIDDRKFKFTVNMGGISLTKSSIKFMEINSRRPETGFVEGSMVIDNTSGAFDDISPFVGDPFMDILYVYIQALAGESEVPTPPLEYTFSVYLVEDIGIGSWPQSAKRIKFREVGAQALRTLKNTISIEDFSEFSNRSAHLLSNNERSIRSDRYLRKVFEKAGIPVSDEEWFEGKYHIPIVSPFGNEYLYDAVKKIHPRHIYKDRPYDYMYTFWNSQTDEMKSIPLSKLFSEEYVLNPDWVLESFILGFTGKVQSGGGGSVVAKTASSDVSVIKSFSFTDSNSEVLSRKLSVHIPLIETRNSTRYDTGAGKFLEMWQDYDQFYRRAGWPNKKEAPPGVKLNEKLKKNVLLTGDTEISGLQNDDYAKDIELRARLFYTTFVNSKKVNITTRGMPYRESGLFADLASIETEVSPKHKKMLGRYWIYSCKHIFSYDKYWNEITMLSP